MAVDVSGLQLGTVESREQKSCQGKRQEIGEE